MSLLEKRGTEEDLSVRPGGSPGEICGESYSSGLLVPGGIGLGGSSGGAWSWPTVSTPLSPRSTNTCLPPVRCCIPPGPLGAPRRSGSPPILWLGVLMLWSPSVEAAEGYLCPCPVVQLGSWTRVPMSVRGPPKPQVGWHHHATPKDGTPAEGVITRLVGAIGYRSSPGLSPYGP